jgi:acyl-CoA reductase-like NAD-dependent aldehyde dehydrogenase
MVMDTDKHASSIVQEEIFGPVFTVIRISDLNEAIRKSNEVIYELGASVWTNDVTRALRAVRDLRFGTV